MKLTFKIDGIFKLKREIPLASYELLLSSMISSVVRSTRAVVMIYYYVAVQALLPRMELMEVVG